MKMISKHPVIRALRRSAAVCVMLALGCPAVGQPLDELTLHTTAHFKGLAWGYVERTPRPMLMDVLRDIYFRSDVDGSSTVTVEDALIKQRLEHAKRRTSFYSYWAGHDVNGDTVVTIEEIRQTYLPEARGSLIGHGVVAESIGEVEIQDRLDSEVTNRIGSLFDTNGDGVFTFEEMVSGAEARFPASREGIARLILERGNRWRSPILVSPMFDINEDGTVTQDEFLAPYVSLLSVYDSDGDGSLSAQELEPLVALANENFEATRSIKRSLWLD